VVRRAGAAAGSWRGVRVPTIWAVLNRRLASLLAAVTVAGLAATGCAEQSAAVRVDDRSVSRSDFEDALDLFYENDELRGLLFQNTTQDQLRTEDGPRDAYTQEFVGALARTYIEFLVVEHTLESEGIELTDADRQAVEDQLDQRLTGGIDALPETQRTQVVDGFAGLDKLRAELGDEQFNVVIGEVVDEVDITVSSRYGSWDDEEFTVTPPPGPAGAEGTSGDGADAGSPTG
jgi:hypothetical protein